MARPQLYVVEILDNKLQPITRIKGFYPLANDKHYLEYSQKLSDVGVARFRVSTKDPIFSPVGGTGDIFQPWFNHVRITRQGIIVWQGVIVRNPHQTKLYVEVEARTYLYWLNKVLVNHDTSVTAGDGLDNYRTFKTGTMGQAVTQIIQEARQKFPAGHPMATIQVGAIENPSFPANYVKADGVTQLTGPWTFSSDLTLQFDYKSILYVLTSLGIYGQCDFELVPTFDAQNNMTLTFNFKVFLGNKQPNVMFEYGTYGTIADYDIPRDGVRMANDITGIAVDPDGKVLHANAPDIASVNKYGDLQDVAAYGDVKSINALKSRLVETQRIVSVPTAAINVDLNDKAYPLGMYGIGDIVTIKIRDHFIAINEVRRVVAFKVVSFVTGEEQISLSTNVPRSTQ